jgi:hypothetical protein
LADEKELEKELAKCTFGKDVSSSSSRVILIGSRAAHYFLGDIGRSVSHADYDLIASPTAYLQMRSRHQSKLASFSCTQFWYKASYTPSIVKQKQHQQQQQQQQPPPSAVTVSIVKCRLKLEKGGEFEVEIPLDNGSTTDRILQLPSFEHRQYIQHFQQTVEVAPPHLLERIKRSHVYWPIQFQKTIDDLHQLKEFLLTNPAGIGKPLATYDDIMVQRYGEAEQRNGIPADHIHMNVTNEEFLDREGILTVRKIIPHDDIHELVKFGDKPMYMRIKKDLSKAACDEKLFNALTLEERIQDVQEEGMVLALERYLLLGRLTVAAEAYRRALERICTTITKGWFREFAIDHYPQIRKLPIEKDLLKIRDHIWNLQKAKHALAVANDPWAEWFDRNELKQLEHIRSSWNSPDEIPDDKTVEEDDYGTIQKLGAGYFLLDKIEYKLQWSYKTWNGGGDCTHHYNYAYTFHITQQSNVVASWCLGIEVTVGNYDSNNNDRQYHLEQCEINNKFPTMDFVPNITDMLAWTIGGLTTDAIRIILSYLMTDAAPFANDHFLVRFFMVHFMTHNQYPPHMPADVIDCFEQYTSQRLAKQRHALQLVHDQRDHVLYQFYLANPNTITFSPPFATNID